MLKCPVCGLPVLLIFHEWRGLEDTATFEYHHYEDAAKDLRGEPTDPCIVVLPFDEALLRYDQDQEYLT